MTQDNPLNIAKGSVLHNRYRVEQAIGTGSMGMVFRCSDLRADGRPVALKVLFEEYARDETGMQRFKNEIIAAYEVVHRNVVQPFDYFKDGDLIAYTMEYVQGEDLATKLADDKEVPIPIVVSWLMEMCRGVQAIHAKGIIHRDLKPENVMVSSTGEVKIMDFGIAKTLDGKKLTAHGAILGTVEYMSPEYLSDDLVHPLGDVYSLGVIGYELLTRALPHAGATMFDVMQAKLSTQPRPPQELRAECPAALGNMIVKAMHSVPEHRYQSARRLLIDLTTLGYQPHTRVPTAELEREYVEEVTAQAEAYDLPPVLSESPVDPSDPPQNDLEAPSEADTQDEAWRMIQAAAETPLGDEFRQTTPEPPRNRKLRSSGGSSRGAIRKRFFPLMLGAILAAVFALYFVTQKNSSPKVSEITEDPQLIESVKKCDFEKVEKLLEAKANLNARDAGGDSALAWAVRSSCLPVVNLLIEQGAQISTRSDAGVSPLEWARRGERNDIAKLLLHYGAEETIENESK